MSVIYVTHGRRIFRHPHDAPRTRTAPILPGPCLHFEVALSPTGGLFFIRPNLVFKVGDCFVDGTRDKSSSVRTLVLIFPRQNNSRSVWRRLNPGARFWAVFRLLTATFSIAGFVGGLWALSYTDARAYEMPYDPYKWCAEYSDAPGGGGTDCGFLTIEQCRAAISGVGGSCEFNQFYNPRRSPSRRYRRKPH